MNIELAHFYFSSRQDVRVKYGNGNAVRATSVNFIWRNIYEKVLTAALILATTVLLAAIFLLD